jgi:hypothetical protein
MWSRLCRVLVLSSVFCPLSSAYAASPNNVQLTYDLYKGSINIGLIEETYTRDKDHYTLSSTTRAVGLFALFKSGKIIISSSGSVSAKGLQPLRFSDQREGEEHRNRRAEFDWETKQLTLIQKKLRTVVALRDGTQDRLSAMYQFMFLPLQSATSLDFPMTNGSKLDNYRYTIIHQHKIKTPAGDFDTLYLDNQPKKGESRTEIWLATEHHNLPCKMTITDADGGQFTQVLSKLSVLP